MQTMQAHKETTTATTHSWPTSSIGEVLSLQATLRPDAEAVVCGSARISFGTLNSRSLAIQEQIAQLGLRQHDKVGVLYPNVPDFIAIFFAIVNLGAVVVPINPMLKSSEIAHILSDSGAKAIIVHEKCLHEVVTALPQIEGLEHLIVGDCSNGLPAYPGLKEIALTSNAQAEREVTASKISDPKRDLAVLVYTSGTTGKPKGAMLTHDCVMSVFPFNIFSSLDLGESDRIVGLLPMCHIYGIGALVCAPIALGCTVVILPKFDAKAALECLAAERITMVPGVPSMYSFILMEYEQNKVDLPSLRYCLSAAAPIAPELLDRIQTELGATVVEGYGMSETAGGGTVNPPRAGKVGSVGKSIPGVSLAIMAAAGEQLPPGRDNVGEIALQGDCVMLGYHQQPEATEEVIRNGWLLTGDLGYKDEDGYVYIVGRKKELIIRGGQNIYPREIEEVILRMEGVVDAAVIGVPDELMGERVKAFIVLKPGYSCTEEDVKEFCGQHIAPYKVPRLVEFITEMPRNSTGKILKRMLK